MDWKWLLYTVLGALADLFDLILTALVPLTTPQRSLSPSDVDHMTDEELLDLYKKSPMLSDDPWMSLRKLTPNTVAKPSQDGNSYDMTEAKTLNWLFINTPVPVPRVRRTVDWYIIMDYIPGKELSSIWTTLSTWKKIWIAFTLRRYLRRIHRIKSSPTTPPGPISTRGPLRCHSPIFSIRSPRGPFNSYSDLATWFNNRNNTTWDQKPIPLDDPRRKDLFDDSKPLVLTHQDLNLSNIIIGEDGQVWIIDWAGAGYYPPWFEYVTMQLQNRDPIDRPVGTEYRFWKLLIPFICGPYFKQERWYKSMAGSVEYK